METPFSDIQYLVFDIESVPDARLIRMAKYPESTDSDDVIIQRLKDEMMAITDGRSDFIPVTFQYPVSLCVAKVRKDFTLKETVSLDYPKLRPQEITRLFWHGVEVLYDHTSLVTFNGRGFDIPLMELMAYRYGITAKRHFKDKFAGRYRFGTKHIDLQDWLSNFNAMKMAGGLNMLAKVLGKPGKMGTTGDQVHELHAQGKIEQINDYCVHDVLDTYFVFLRSRVLLGELTIEKEQEIVNQAKEMLLSEQDTNTAYKTYMENWGDWNPWPVVE